MTTPTNAGLIIPQFSSTIPTHIRIWNRRTWTKLNNNYDDFCKAVTSKLTVANSSILIKDMRRFSVVEIKIDDNETLKIQLFSGNDQNQFLNTLASKLDDKKIALTKMPTSYRPYYCMPCFTRNQLEVSLQLKNDEAFAMSDA